MAYVTYMIRSPKTLHPPGCSPCCRLWYVASLIWCVFAKSSWYDTVRVQNRIGGIIERLLFLTLSFTLLYLLFLANKTPLVYGLFLRIPSHTLTLSRNPLPIFSEHDRCHPIAQFFSSHPHGGSILYDLLHLLGADCRCLAPWYNSRLWL